MNIKIVIGAIAAVVVIGGGIFFLSGNKHGAPQTLACTDICRQANIACPSLINEDDCNSKCGQLSQEIKEHLQTAATCEELTSRPDLIADLIIPKVAAPESVDKNTTDCEAACGSYVSKCLTLVPNATPALFDEGLVSCMAECAGWNIQKVDCMINAFDCEAMTNVCGL